MDTASKVDSSLQEIIDHHEIRKMLSVCCHGCDRGDEPRMKSVYGEAGYDDHGRYKGLGRDFSREVMKIMAAEDLKCTHLLGQSLINLSGNSAGAETYFLATMYQKDEGGDEVVTLLSGRFVDTLTRDSGQWKIDKRICVRDWSITLDVKKDSFRDFNFVQGLLSGQDPSYAVLGLSHPGLPWTGAMGP